jgi:glycerophosphoryl diester phosphodiesterase
MTVIRTLHGAGNVRSPRPLPADAPVDALEADAWVVRGRIVLQHERPIGGLPLALHQRGVRLRPQPGTLEALLAAAGKRTLVLDVRSWVNDPAPDVFRALAQLDGAARTTITFSCEAWQLADRLRAWMPDARAAYSIRSEPQLRRFIEGRAAGTLPAADVAVRHSLLHDYAEVQALRRFTPRVSAWTVDDAARARALAAWGVDEVVSNRVEVLAAL